MRSLRRHPGFAVVAVLSLACAIALNTTMYSVLDGLLYPRLNVPEAQNVFRIRLWGNERGKLDAASQASVLRSATRVFKGFTYEQMNFGRWGAVELGTRYAQVTSTTVAPNYFHVLEVGAERGRVFDDADLDAPTPLAMISDRLAATLSPDAPFPIGATIDVDGEPRIVIGVIDRRSVPPGSTDLWVLPPATVSLASMPINLVRMREGVSGPQRDAELRQLADRIANLIGASPKDIRYQLGSITERPFQFGNFDYALASAVLAVLLVACANLANLQLARGLQRNRELAVRAALGATRLEIIKQLMVESAVLAGAGLLLGVVLTWWGVHLLSAHIPPRVGAYIVAPQISWRVFAFAMMASVLCVLIIGLVPALRLSRVDPNELLKSSAGTGALRRHRRQYGVMVAIEVALSLALLIGATIVVRTAASVRRATLPDGADSLAVAAARLSPPRDSVMSFYDLTRDLLARVRSAPDASDAAMSMNRAVVKHAVTAGERNGPPREHRAPMYSYSIVTPEYLRTLRRPIVRGRDFLPGIPVQSEVIVDEHTARVLWPNVDPVGLQLKLGAYASDAPWVRVVGVVRDYADPRAALRTSFFATSYGNELGQIFYLPAATDTFALTPRAVAFMNVVVRAATDPERMPITLTRLVSHTGWLRYWNAQTYRESIGIDTERQAHDFVAGIFTLFAALSLGLAAFGIYAIVTHSVVERTRELGVRLALGASTREIVNVVIREGNAMVLAGVAIGLYIVKHAVFWLHAYSFDGDEYDAPLFAAVAAALFLVILVSALIPAWRATRIDPVESLRCE
jgi:putative ABC transport system permease protein